MQPNDLEFFHFISFLFIKSHIISVKFIQMSQVWQGWLCNNFVLHFAVANGGLAPRHQGSDSNSSASSLSSSTPLSSLSGLSQVLFPPVFGSEMVDVAISTDDCARRLSVSERTADTTIQTDPQPLSNGTYSGGPVAAETSRTVGATVLLKDSVIRGKGEGPREDGGDWERGWTGTRKQSSGEQEVAKHSPKTAALMALSKPRKQIRRSQSHTTASGETHECLGLRKQRRTFQLHKDLPSFVNLTEESTRTHTHTDHCVDLSLHPTYSYL